MSNLTQSIAPTIHLNRYRYTKHPSHMTTFKHGDLFPIWCSDMLVPGTELNVVLDSFIRQNTPIFPAFGRIEFQADAFFVPVSQVWKYGELFFGAKRSNKITDDFIPFNKTGEYLIPNLSLYSYGCAAQSLSNYLGKPIVGKDSGKSSYGVTGILKERAYYHIWNNYYRAQNYQMPVLVNVGINGYTTDSASVCKIWNNGLYLAGYNNSQIAGLPLMKVCKSFDYFTAATIEPSSLKVDLPLGTIAPIVVENDETSGSIAMGTTLATKEAVSARGDTVRVGLAGHLPGTTAYADLERATAATIDELKTAVSMEHYLEKLDNYCGDYYNGVLRGIYGTNNGDLNVNKPEHLGSIKFNINVNQVTAMADTTQGSAIKPAGSSAAVSITGNSSHVFHKAVSEHGYIMILGFARVKDQVYSQGISRDDSKVSSNEFFNPYFTFLSDQEIKNQEIKLVGNGNDKKTFGFQEAWAEYRYARNFATGYMGIDAPSDGALGNVWSYAQNFTSTPELNDSWIVEDRNSVARTLTTGTAAPYDYFAYFRLKMTETSTVSTNVLPGTRGVLGL